MAENIALLQGEDLSVIEVKIRTTDSSPVTLRITSSGSVISGIGASTMRTSRGPNQASALIVPPPLRVLYSGWTSVGIVPIFYNIDYCSVGGTLGVDIHPAVYLKQPAFRQLFRRLWWIVECVLVWKGSLFYIVMVHGDRFNHRNKWRWGSSWVLDMIYDVKRCSPEGTPNPRRIPGWFRLIIYALSQQNEALGQYSIFNATIQLHHDFWDPYWTQIQVKQLHSG